VTGLLEVAHERERVPRLRWIVDVVPDVQAHGDGVTGAERLKVLSQRLN
jgi:hypothetical protein